jgi:hypothetical protein
MQFRRSYSSIVGAACLFWFFSTGAAQALGEADHSIWGDLLSKYVKGGLVDYRGFKSDEGKLDGYLQMLERINSREFSPKERLAFYINAYNAWTIKLVLGGYPGIKSIKDLGTLFSSPWKKKLCKVDGQVLSLDDIEHEIIRPSFRDPRIHFAINCASKGCPPLASEPYRGVILDRQLDVAVRSFVNDPSRYRLDGDDLHVSMIFKWYASDFKDGVLDFILGYAEEDLREALISRQNRIRLKYEDYDWSLNGK